MMNKKEIKNYFRSIIHPDKRVKVCHRCGRLLNYERKTRNKQKVLKKLEIPLNEHKWHKFRLCDECFKDKQSNKICLKVDLENLESFNLTKNYIRRKI